MQLIENQNNLFQETERSLRLLIAQIALNDDK